MCSVSVFDSFIVDIILKTIKIKSSVLHTLLDRPLRILQLQTHLSRLTAKGILI